VADSGRSVEHDGHVVWREPHGNDRFVRSVLTFLEQRAFGGAPRFLGVDERGRQAVSFVPGVVPEAERALSEVQVASAGRLLRRAHDLLAGSHLAGGEEVVCHGDPGPHNVVFRGEVAVALIDWEQAAPGSRLSELAEVAWCLLDDRWEREPPGAARRRIDAFCRGYGWEDVGPVIGEVSVLVRRARDRHARLGIAPSVAHLERLLRWLSEHDGELRAPA
jgi:hypothetical protein